MEPVAGLGLRPRFSYEENTGFPSEHQEQFGVTPPLFFSTLSVFSLTVSLIVAVRRRGLRRNRDQSNPTGQIGLARVKGAKIRGADQLGGCNVQNVECAATNSRGVVERGCFSFHHHPMPQPATRDQQTGGAIMFDFQPRGLSLLEGKPLLKQSQTQPVAQFETVEDSEWQGCGVALTPGISPGRIRVSCVQRKQKAGVSVSLQKRSSARAASTMLGRTLFPNIRRRRAE